MMRLTYPLIFAAIICFGPQKASSQAHITDFTLVNNLSFGTVPTGTTMTISPLSSGAAEFEVVFTNNANNSAQVSLDFTLPANLTSGTSTETITFGPNSAAYNTSNTLSGSTSFDPSQGLTGTIVKNSTLTWYIWIGGGINPQPGQTAGTYSGTISVAGHVGHSGYNSMTIAVSANIIQGLTLTVAGTLDFGTILSPSIPPPLSAQTNGNAPMLTAAGNGGSTITVTYQSTYLLTGPGTSLTFTPSVFGSGSQTNQAGSLSVPSGSTVTLTGSANSSGYYYFWLGGSLDPVPSGEVPGNYNGTFILTISY